MTERNLYEDWAKEIIDKMLDNSYNPYLATNRKDLSKIVAIKLKDDLESFIVSDWFCSGCEYYCTDTNCRKKQC